KKRNLLPKNLAVLKIHKPETLQDALDAKKTLKYEELYAFQKTVLERAKQRKKNVETLCSKEPPKDFETSLSPRQKLLYQRLPFPLTEDQKKVIYEMNIDMDLSETQVIKDDNPFRMSRLLQGDVGSGKTLTAFFLALRAIDSGGQVAILAPTEILSKQHAENASKILEPLNVRIAFLTGNINTAGRKTLLNALKTGLVDIVIGTHALFSQSVVYKNLRFVVIDEQHRFGVVQRGAILDKGRTSVDQLAKQEKGELPRQPDLLLMSATPIPQTLALTIFGDLDVSTIKTMPMGRKPIITHLTMQGNEYRVYEAVREELKHGHQAYFVYPLIEGEEIENQDSDKRVMPLKSAEEMFTFLSQQVYPEYKCALVHSKVEEEKQNEILNGFRDGKIQILIATTVVEVGVDVPNATCMVIEGAERFGLAALHQLRGRVGRGSQQSFCFLIYSQKISEIGKQRMKVLYSTNDGFIIAEEDLKLRGPGDINGIQQSGYFTLGIADPINDKDIMEMARDDILAEN
ncbi:MAG: ATP-dependent DNA helicase RecG, partial [Spirochaetaceae bacterium]|nr:ATP-dependent DNA helicase RecG [Spirochaetaceae bacterium]